MEENKVLIIAEAGVNHNGDFETAKALIFHAAAAGADYVKFQTFKADLLVSKSAKKAAYQSKNFESASSTQYEMLKKLELKHEWHYLLKQYAIENGIKFLSTGFDEESVDFLNELGIDLFKIPSGSITDKRYLQHVARIHKPVILSTGMSTIEEIKEAIIVMESAGLTRDQIVVLHCNTEYPTPMKDVNLKAMNHIGTELNVVVGYSDHTLGIEIPIAAVALGARVIEKHFTLNKSMIGPDHAASLEPDELKNMISSIRNIEIALSGSGYKTPSESEDKNRTAARKSIHLKNDIKKGDILKETDLIMKRPGDGISPMEIDNVIGKKLLNDISADSKLSWEILEN